MRGRNLRRGQPRVAQRVLQNVCGEACNLMKKEEELELKLEPGLRLENQEEESR